MAQDRRCFYCRAVIALLQDATLDHVRAIHRKGGNLWENLVVACLGCNHRKQHHEPDWLLQQNGVSVPYVAYREMTLAPIYILRGGQTVNVGGTRGLAPAPAPTMSEKKKQHLLVMEKVRQMVRERDKEPEKESEVKDT